MTAGRPRDPNIEALQRAVHNVRGPLTVIKAEVQLAARKNAAVKPLADLVDQQVERAQVALDALTSRE